MHMKSMSQTYTDLYEKDFPCHLHKPIYCLQLRGNAMLQPPPKKKLWRFLVQIKYNEKHLLRYTFVMDSAFHINKTSQHHQ